MLSSFSKYRAIKLICNRVIHESEIVCRTISLEGSAIPLHNFSPRN
ncbi:unnamed protein product [Tenebrio molitor]|nr:unnamed protein product [Tenebrio molitor]